MKTEIIGYCSNCKSKNFMFKKKVEGKTESSIIIQETLCHDGYGYDLNTFDIVCAKCKKINTDIYEIKGATQ